MEIVTQSPLTPDEIMGELSQIVAWLEARHVTNVEVMFGFGCESADSQYEPMRIALIDLLEFINRSWRADCFRPGDSDLFITVVDPVVKFQLCHEADIHVVTANVDFAEIVKAHWVAKGWKGHQSPAGPSGEWTPFPAHSPPSL